MSKYECKGGRLLTKDDERKCLCTIRVKRGGESFKEFPGECAAINDDVIQTGGIAIARKILQDIQDNPEMFGPDNMCFQYVFPKISNKMSIILTFSGIDMDRDAYETLTFSLANIIYGMFAIEFGKSCSDSSVRDKALAIVEHMRIVLAELEKVGASSVYESESVLNAESDG